MHNPRSQAALIKLGFVREGVLRRWHRHGDQVHDVILYSWLKEDWERSPLAAEPVRLEGAVPPAFRGLSVPALSCAAAPS